MGGTTAKCALVEDGRFNVESIYYANGYTKGFPIKSPVIDIVEVGSGGGSIAWLDSQSRLHVGPRSAGSTPGPVCYGRGGTEATVTDANLILGRLNADRFLGGELQLDLEGAKNAIRRLTDPLGYKGEEGMLRTADGILALATVTMAGAIRQVSVEHGLDPRDFVLFSYGGGGPLHASALARELFIPMVVIPPAPGNFSAVGMLLADARIDLSETFTGILNETTVASIGEAFKKMEGEAAISLKKEFGAREIFFERYAEMRYLGQRHNIKVPVGTAGDLAIVRQSFERDYKRRYGHSDPKNSAELQALHLSAFARQERPDLSTLLLVKEMAATPSSRRVYFKEAGGFVDAAVFERTALKPGFQAIGPAVIEEYGSTTLIGPDDRFEIGPLREIRIHCGSK
jgi:N-methylhydantoinase A